MADNLPISSKHGLYTLEPTEEHKAALAIIHEKLRNADSAKDVEHYISCIKELETYQYDRIVRFEKDREGLLMLEQKRVGEKQKKILQHTFGSIFLISGLALTFLGQGALGVTIAGTGTTILGISTDLFKILIYRNRKQ